jgi:hypothetical protein
MPASSVPNASSKSSLLASTPLETLANTAVVWSTSSRSFSLQADRGKGRGRGGEEWADGTGGHRAPWRGGLLLKDTRSIGAGRLVLGRKV